MCIFAGEVEQVGDTKIFVAASGHRQFTAYQMQFTLPRLTREDIVAGRTVPGNAMILPVPWRQGETLELVDMSKAEDFFSELKKLVPETRFRSRGAMSSKSMTLGMEPDHLEVFRVGKFEVSIAYTPADIDRANPDVFKLGDKARQTLEAHYPSGYAFIICALAESGGIHPIAYISEVNDTLFVPTRHEHGDGLDLPRWDHDIYVPLETAPPLRNPADSPLRNHRTEGYNGDRQGGGVYREVWDKLTSKVPELRPFANPLVRYRYKGRFKNIDFEVPRRA